MKLHLKIKANKNIHQIYSTNEKCNRLQNIPSRYSLTSQHMTSSKFGMLDDPTKQMLQCHFDQSLLVSSYTYNISTEH